MSTYPAQKDDEGSMFCMSQPHLNNRYLLHINICAKHSVGKQLALNFLIIRIRNLSSFSDRQVDKEDP